MRVVVGLQNDLRRGRECDGSSKRLEGFDNQESPHYPLETGQKHPTPDVRQVGTAQVPLMHAFNGEAAENAV